MRRSWIGWDWMGKKPTLDTLDIFEKNCLLVAKVIGMALFY